MMIWVSGSLAFDRIMDYPGRFAEHINPKKLHVINLSFLAKTLELSYGGTAGNIAYGLRSLGVPAGVIGNLGKDGGEYLQRLKRSGADIACVRVYKNSFTAGAYIITDRFDNQISAFFAGAMLKQSRMPPVRPSDTAIVSPDSASNIASLAAFYRRKNLRYVFDPGQAMTMLKKPQLVAAAKSASVIIGNDYEIDLMVRRSGFRLKQNQTLITTFGQKGSKIETAEKTFRIPAVKAKKVVDPTGAGDAYRAGLLAGMLKGYDFRKCGRLAATVAAYAVETQGAQTYKVTGQKAKRRYSESFGGHL